MLPLSGRDEKSLRELAKKYIEYLSRSEISELRNICFTAGQGRTHFEERLAVVGVSPSDMRQKLMAWLEGRLCSGISKGKTLSKDDSKIAFLFTGSGAQYFEMGKGLYESQAPFRRSVDHCVKILSPYLNLPILSVMWGADREKLDEGQFTQPALFVLEYALAELWKSYGVVPSAVLGHSTGEIVAACIAGVLSLEDGLKL